MRRAGRMAWGEIEFPRACPPWRTAQQEIKFPTNSISPIVSRPSKQNNSKIELLGNLISTPASIPAFLSISAGKKSKQNFGRGYPLQRASDSKAVPSFS